MFCRHVILPVDDVVEVHTYIHAEYLYFKYLLRAHHYEHFYLNRERIASCGVIRVLIVWQWTTNVFAERTGCFVFSFLSFFISACFFLSDILYAILLRKIRFFVCDKILIIRVAYVYCNVWGMQLLTQETEEFDVPTSDEPAYSTASLSLRCVYFACNTGLNRIKEK